jgi:hypothetical protein
MPRFALPGLLLLLTSPWACASNSASTGDTATVVVTDTLGLRFGLDCSSGLCLLTPENSSIAPISCAGSAGTDVFLLAWEPLLSIYAMHISSSGDLQLDATTPSHPVACATDVDCLAPGVTIGAVTNSYTCQHGLCLLQQSCSGGVCTPWDGVLLIYDVLTLCQADLRWPTACPYITSQPFADRVAAVANACGPSPTCATIPPACRQLIGPGIDGGT